MSAKTYDGHTARFAASVLMCMPKLSDIAMQTWIDCPRVLQEKLSHALCPSTEEKSPTLVIRDRVVLPKIVNDFYPKTYFKTRKGLWIAERFRTTVLTASVAPTRPLTFGSATAYDLTRQAYDLDLRANLPEGYEWKADEFCARVAQLLEKQWGGKDGALHTSGQENLFYIPGSVVIVYWNVGCAEWRMNVSDSGGAIYDKDTRLFIPN